MIRMRSFVFLALVACTSKGSTTTPGTDTGPPKVRATIARGAPVFGCFAFSESTHSFACVTGSKSTGNDSTFELRYVGSPANADAIADPIADPAAKELDETLARDVYWKLDGEAKPLANGAIASITPTTTVVWKRTQTAPAAENQPPTFDDNVIAKCATGEAKLFESPEGEGLDLKLTTRVMGKLGLLEIASHVGREGESTDAFEAVVFELDTCTIIGR